MSLPASYEFGVRFCAIGRSLSADGGWRRKWNDLTKPHIKIWHKTYLTNEHCLVSVCHALCESHIQCCVQALCVSLLLPHFLFSADANKLPSASNWWMLSRISFFFVFLRCSLSVYVFTFLGEPRLNEEEPQQLDYTCPPLALSLCVRVCLFANELHLIQHIHYIIRNWDLV